jgi:DNA polymerase III subunit gamma/tau
VTSTVPHQALYRVWRAQTFAGIVGQDAAVTVLRNAVRTDSVAHALLFVGPRGTGKTSMARIVAKALNCTNLQDGDPDDRCPSCVAIREGTSLDVAELDAASNNKVDDIRELLPRIATAPSDLRRKVFIVDEVQRITEGWDVLLKTLEEPPDHVAFIFCTTDATKIRPAVLSRVQRFDFRRLTVEQISGKLRRILDDVGREADDDAIALIATLAAGGMRDAESMLDQLLSGGDGPLTGERVRDLLGLAGEESVRGFLEALVGGAAAAGMAILDELEDRGRDLRAFLDQVIEALRAALVAGLGGASGMLDASPPRLAAVGRRLAAIDPSRLGPGGIRFQLDLALLEGPPDIVSVTTFAAPTRSGTAIPPTTAPAPATPARPEPGDEAQAPAPAPVDEPVGAVPATSTATDPATAEPAPVARPEVRSRPARRTPATPPGDTPAATPSADVPIPAEATTTTAAADGSSKAGPSTLGLPMLERAWPAVVADLSQQPAVKPLIVACRPVAVEGRVVTLGFPENQAFLKDLLERRRSTVEDGIARQAGEPVSVRFVATNIESLTTAPADGDADRLLTEARRIFADDLADVGEVS